MMEVASVFMAILIMIGVVAWIRRREQALRIFCHFCREEITGIIREFYRDSIETNVNACTWCYRKHRLAEKE